MDRFTKDIQDLFLFMVHHGYDATPKTYRLAVVTINSADDIPF